jgi:hypothetical protein
MTPMKLATLALAGLALFAMGFMEHGNAREAMFSIVTLLIGKEWLNKQERKSKPRVPPVALVLLVSLALGACSLLSVIAKVLPYITEAGNVVDAIEAYADQAFAQNPNPDLQHKVTVGIAKSRQALDTVNAAARGAESLANEDLVAAFNRFREAYEALLALTQPLGNVRVQLPGAMLAVEGDVLFVPTPETLFAVEGG